MSNSVGFVPNHDEASRQAFVGGLKGYINFALEGQLQRLFDEKLVPEQEAKAPGSVTSRADGEALLVDHPLYNLWETLTFHSQNQMWDSVADTADRTMDNQIAAFEYILANPRTDGTLKLQDSLVVKAPIATTEIHRQPGGYWRETRPHDLAAGLNYAGTVDLYRNAKGMGTGGKVGSDSLGQLLAGVAKKYAPDLEPKAILDMGCGTGEQTLAYKRVFPGAKVTGIDCARPLLRYAHGYAQSEGVAIDFAEMDAGQTDFADGSFDLIVSIIMFHETTQAQVRDILRESWRLVRPGGLVLHLDVPYQPNRMPLFKQVTNHWQVRNNGEPFWTGFAEMDMKDELAAAGLDPGATFANYEAAGPATFYFFGGRKDVSS